MSEDQLPLFTDNEGRPIWHDPAWAHSYAAIRANFLRLLADGKPVAFEAAMVGVETPEGIDRRTFGMIPQELFRVRLIQPCGYIASENRSHHSGTKRLWRLVTPGEVSRCSTCGQPLERRA